jgi:hypothetical protein
MLKQLRVAKKAAADQAKAAKQALLKQQRAAKKAIADQAKATKRAQLAREREYKKMKKWAQKYASKHKKFAQHNFSNFSGCELLFKGQIKVGDSNMMFEPSLTTAASATSILCQGNRYQPEVGVEHCSRYCSRPSAGCYY